MMKGGAERVATRLWEGAGPGWRVARGALAPASLLYRLGVGARGLAYRTGLMATTAVSVRTVSIGNLRIGGTGKTPLTRWLATEVSRRGVAVAIASRGYGGSAESARVVGDGSELVSTIEESGDEAVMLARTAGVPVVAGRDRVAAAELAVRKFGSRLVLCDDAFQHRRMRRDLDVVLVDSDETGGLTRLLPAGPLREPVSALARAGVVVVCEREGTPVPVPAPAGGLVVRARFAPTALVRAETTGWHEGGLAALAGQRVLAVSGVARPGALYQSLHEWEADLVHVLEYRDHHPYDTKDWKEISQAAKDVDLIVTTEKDLVKLERFPFARGKLVAVRLGVEIDDAPALLACVIGDARTSG